ncbi:hypothetical protein D3C84_1092790 [compost metagenome]
MVHGFMQCGQSKPFISRCNANSEYFPIVLEGIGTTPLAAIKASTRIAHDSMEGGLCEIDIAVQNQYIAITP